MRAYSRGAKRRNKKTVADLPALAPTPKREKNGCFVERTRQQNKDPHPKETALKARCRMMGWKPTAENLSKADAAFFSSQGGAAIYISVADASRRAKLWKTFCDFDGADELYNRRILGRSRHAKTGKIEFYHEHLSTENAPERDTRDEDTKDRDATNRWMHWQGLIGRMDAKARTALYDGVFERRRIVVVGKVTSAGDKFLEAIADLTEIAEKVK